MPLGGGGPVTDPDPRGGPSRLRVFCRDVFFSSPFPGPAGCVRAGVPQVTALPNCSNPTAGGAGVRDRG